MAETADYPLIAALRDSGSVHLRTYDTGAAATRDADIGAVVAELIARGHHVEVSAREPHKVVSYSGRGWRDPHLRVTQHHSLLSVTAAVAEAWQRTDRSVALVCDNWFDLRTGPGDGHDDTAADTWLAAIVDGDTDTLGALTGLDVATYLGATPDARPVTVVVSSTPRRGGRPDDLSAVKGGFTLVARCDSACAVDSDHTIDGDTVTGTARWTKRLDGHVGVARVQRRIAPVTCWTRT